MLKRETASGLIWNRIMNQRTFKEISNEIEDKIIAGAASIEVSGLDVVVRNQLGVTIGKWLKENYPDTKVIYT